ncbi:MAG: hypothetical protein MJ010_08820 [Paludibacteraceae bacterium]|nr:hypothetical protein [Paludibacteraceae bacterium]
MKKQKLLKFLRHRLGWMLCLVAFLAIGLNLGATDYYFWGWNNNSPNTGSPTVKAQKMAQNGNTYTYNISSFSDGNYCFFITSNGSQTYNDVYNQKPAIKTINQGNYSLSWGQYGGIDVYHVWNDKKTAPMTITFVNEDGGSISATTGGSPSPTGVGYALGGYLNQGEGGGDITTYKDKWKLTETASGSGVFKGTFTFTATTGGNQYLWIIDSNNGKYGKDSSGEELLNPGESVTFKNTGNRQKVIVRTSIGTKYTVTFTPSTGTLTWDESTEPFYAYVYEETGEHPDFKIHYWKDGVGSKTGNVKVEKLEHGWYRAAVPNYTDRMYYFTESGGIETKRTKNIENIRKNWGTTVGYYNEDEILSDGKARGENYNPVGGLWFNGSWNSYGDGLAVEGWSEERLAYYATKELESGTYTFLPYWGGNKACEVENGRGNFVITIENIEKDGGTWKAGKIVLTVRSRVTFYMDPSPYDDWRVSRNGIFVDVEPLEQKELTPAARLGRKPVKNDDQTVTGYVYVARQGCNPTSGLATVNHIRLYYAMDATPDAQSSFVEISGGSYTTGNDYQLIIDDGEFLAQFTEPGHFIHMRGQIDNSNGFWTDLSDEYVMPYQPCEGAITMLEINPQSQQMLINAPFTFTYNTNHGAEPTAWSWKVNGVEKSTTSTLTYIPTTSDPFTVDLTATGCNTKDAVQQTYTVCSAALAGVSISDAPAEPVEVGSSDITLTANATNPEGYQWYVNGEIQDDATESTFTFSPSEVGVFTIDVDVTGCPSTTIKATCTVDVRQKFDPHASVAKNFTACDGSHQLNITEMFTPAPSNFSARTSGGADATSEFKLENGVMVWNPGNKTTGDYEYNITAKKDGYIDKVEQLTIHFTKSAPEDYVTRIEASPSTTTTPWTEVTLTAYVNDVKKDVTDVAWSVSPATLIEPGGDGKTLTAKFKGKSKTSTTVYTVTAKGLSESCGESQADTIEITVNPDKKEDCD